MDLLEGYKQQPPFTIQIEPTEGCNLGCSFCGLRGMREKGTTPWKFMTLETAEKIAKSISRVNWTSKIIFAMHGEPTLNPQLFEIIELFRKYLPNNIFHIISNGYNFVHGDLTPIEYVRKLEKSGINHILLDNYSPNGDWSKVVDSVGDNYEILYLDKDKTPMFRSDKKFNIIILPPIVTTKISFVRNLKNHCGAAFPLDDSFNEKRCAVPFRELSFRWDGNVALCCDDFRGQYPIANINDFEDIVELWNHERFQAARIMLYNARRSFVPCKGCSNVSMRIGLLPDKLGKDDMPEIHTLIEEYCQMISKEESPLSKIVKREWEK